MEKDNYKANSWVKVMNLGYKKGFEFWGIPGGSIFVYKNGQHVISVSSLKELKAVVFKG
jgi:hypothetical protein